MQSTVQLFNVALARLGGVQLPQNISSLETDAVGQICQNLFPQVLDLTLAAHAWAFAVRRISLPAPTLSNYDAAPNPAYPLAYDLPSDCLKPLRLEGAAETGRNGPAYVLEGRTLRCGEERAALVYVARVNDPNLWPPSFADALAWALAAELASARNNDVQKQQWCLQNYKIALAEAIARDQADQNPRPLKSPWTAARFGEGEY